MKDVAAEKRNDIAIPVKIMVSGVDPFSLAIKTVMTIASRENAKEAAINRIYEETRTPPRYECINSPAPKTIAKAAPKPAADEIPRVNGDASGFRNETWVTAPASASPAPAKTATRALGNLISKRIVLELPDPKLSISENTSIGGMNKDPTQRDRMNTITRDKANKERIASLLLEIFLYSETSRSGNLEHHLRCDLRREVYPPVLEHLMENLGSYVAVKEPKDLLTDLYYIYIAELLRVERLAYVV